MPNPAMIPNKWIPLTKSDVPNIAGSHRGSLCSAIRCEVAGTAVVGYGDGSTTTFTMAVGEQISGRFFMLYTASTGTFHGALY